MARSLLSNIGDHVLSGRAAGMAESGPPQCAATAWSHMMWGSPRCYQFIPRMTSDLCSDVFSWGPLHPSEHGRWETVLLPNTCRVVRSLVSGVKYLHDRGIQHYDIKGSNILI